MPRKLQLDTAAVDRATQALQKAIADLEPLGTIQDLYVVYVLALRGGNKVQATKALRIDRRTIQRWAKAKPRMAKLVIHKEPAL